MVGVSGGNTQAHVDHVLAEACFFIGLDGAVVGVVDVQPEFGDVTGEGPGLEGVDDHSVDAFAAMGGLYVHEAEVSMKGVA